MKPFRVVQIGFTRGVDWFHLLPPYRLVSPKELSGEQKPKHQLEVNTT